MDVQWPTVGGWALAVCSAIAMVAWAMIRSAAKQDEEVRQRMAKRRAYDKAVADWHFEVKQGGVEHLEMAMILKRKINDMRSHGWHLLAFALVAGIFAGCHSTKPDPVPPVMIPIGTHIQQPAPGDVVPPLPEGESRWWLCTPTGLSMLLPTDSPVLMVEDDETKGGQ